MPPPPPPPSRPRSPPPCPPPPPPSPVGRPLPSSQPAQLSSTSTLPTPQLPARDYTPVLPAIILPAQSRSELLAMLRGLAKLVSYLGAAGGVMGFIYYRWLLPRLDDTLARRAALKAHALALAGRFASQLTKLHAAQTAAHSSAVSSEPAARALLPALQELKSTLEPHTTSDMALSHVADLTSYAAARVYGPLPGRSGMPHGVGGGIEQLEEKWEHALTQWEREAEGVIREARAVKGLVLNRRSFAGAV